MQELKTCTPEAHEVSRDPNSKPTNNLSSSTQDSPHPGKKEQAGRVKKDADVQLTPRRTSQQQKDLPRLTKAKLGTAPDIQN